MLYKVEEQSFQKLEKMSIAAGEKFEQINNDKELLAIALLANIWFEKQEAGKYCSERELIFRYDKEKGFEIWYKEN